MNFNIDLAIVAVYMVACLVIGLFKFGKIKNIRDYTLGAKPFSTIVLIATTFATIIGSENIMGRIGQVYELGLIYLISFIFVPISWVILAKLLAPNLNMFRKHKFMSLSDIMEYWYGKTGRWVTNIISILSTIALAAVSSVAIGYLLYYFLNIPENISIMIGLIVVTSYSMFGGIASVAFTDVFQFLIFFVALPIACAIGYHSTGGIKEIWSSLPKAHTQINDIPLFIGLVFYALMPAVEIPFIQRALIAKNEKQFVRSFICVALLTIPMLIVIILIGLMTYQENPDLHSNETLYHFIDYYLPTGMKGLMIAGLLAAIMSTQDSYLNTTSSLISHDICKEIWPSLTEKQELLIARISCVFIAMASVLVILVNKKYSIMEIIWIVVNFSAPLVVTPTIIGLLKVYINKKSFIFVVIASLATTCGTGFFTGKFDTRSITVGMITSAAVLYILHRRYKKEKIFSFPRINISLIFNKLNKRIINHSYSIGSLYSVGTVLCINSLVSLYFVEFEFLNPLNISLVTTGSLLLMLLLNELWSSYFKRRVIDVWRFCLILSLIFIPFYILFINEFHILWLCNFILSIVLYSMMSDIIISLVFMLIIGLVSYLLSQKVFFYKANLIDETFAYISCSAIISAIILQFYKRYSITKSAHEEITYELKNIMKERITESLNIKEEFLNKLNHELRIPLSVMINTSDGIYEMWDKLSDKDKKKYLKDIIDNRERFESYTSNILNLADLKQKKFKLNIEQNVDLIKLSRAAIDETQSLIIKNDKNLKIELEIKNIKSTNIACDEKRIEQVINNLLSNAIKYSNEGIIKVFIKANGDKIEISVSDQGVGIPDNEKKKIFEPFFEGSRTKSSAEGKGLGLSVVQQIVILHEGYIEVQDNEPKGSIFKVVLPYNTEQALMHHELKKKVAEKVYS